MNVIDVVIVASSQAYLCAEYSWGRKIFPRSRNPAVDMNSEHVKELLHHDYHKLSFMI